MSAQPAASYRVCLVAGVFQWLRFDVAQQGEGRCPRTSADARGPAPRPKHDFLVKQLFTQAPIVADTRTAPDGVSAGQGPFSDWWAILGLNQ